LRGDYWVLYNYITAEKHFQCNESITYTTHGGFEFFDNLEPLLHRWQGPLSLAVYAPGTDFETALETIFFYRDCTETSLVRDYVTFHIFFDFDHIPSKVPKWQSLTGRQKMCKAGVVQLTSEESYKQQNNLDYPINVARNVARQNVQTHFVFPSDIELYPSPDLIPAFLDMIRQNGPRLQGKNPRVFVNNIFEIEAGYSLPMDKAKLVELIGWNVVIPFHKNLCQQCHMIPCAEEWMENVPSSGMGIFYTGRREKPFNHWEPIYIGTNQEPEYDEILSWEGRSDKMVQSYKMCSLQYDYHILDNAFLIHRPGIKTHQTFKNRKKIDAQNQLIQTKILPQIKKLYPVREECGEIY